MGRRFDAYRAATIHTAAEHYALVRAACDDLGFDYDTRPLLLEQERAIIRDMDPDTGERVLAECDRSERRRQAVAAICSPRNFVDAYEPICDEICGSTPYFIAVGVSGRHFASQPLSRRRAQEFTTAPIYATPSGCGFVMRGGTTIWRVPETELIFVRNASGTPFWDLDSDEIETICPAAWEYLRDDFAEIDADAEPICKPPRAQPPAICEATHAEPMQVALF